MKNFIAERQKIVEEIESRLMTFELSEIGELTGVPSALYQRFFSYMYGITISSYIRRRKLTIAAFKLLHGEWSVTIASLECGYEDTSSFSRAFKEQFHVSPSNVTMKQFEEFKFEKLTLSTLPSITNRKATLISAEYPVIHEQYLVGIGTKQYPNRVGASLWEVFRNEDIAEKLLRMEGYEEKSDDYIAIGYMGDFSDSSALGREYMIGRLFNSIPSNIDGLEVKKLQKMQLVHSKITGKSIDDIVNDAYAVTCDIVNKNGYEIDYSSFFWLEYYDSENFGNVGENQKELNLDFYMPCKKIVKKSRGLQ